MIKKPFIHALSFFIIDYYYHYLGCLKVVTIGAGLHDTIEVGEHIRTTNYIRNNYRLDGETERKSFSIALHSTSYAHVLLRYLKPLNITSLHVCIEYRT